MAVPYTFGSATTSIPLSQLDSNFATAITLGNTAVQLGNTITNLTGVSNLASASSLSLGTSGNTTAVTIDTSQNVGIGIAAPTRQLTIYSSSPYIALQNSTTGTTSGDGLQIQQAGSDSYVWNYENSFLSLGTNATERMRIDSSGNVGIGVTPNSGWQSTANALQLGANVSLSKYGMNYNAYYDGTNYRYLNNGYASQYQQGQNHYWLVAGSGTAGAVISGGGFNNGTTAMTLDSSGRLLVGTTSAVGNARCIVSSDPSTGVDPMIVSNTRSAAATDYHIICYRNGSIVGSIQTTLSSTIYATSSDYRLKENIVPMSGALSKVLQLKPVTYKWKLDGTESQGFIAHELQEVVPDAVCGQKDEVDANGNPKYQGIDTSFLVATLTAAIQELSAKNDALTARIVALEAK
jgi:hypothetical protein